MASRAIKDTREGILDGVTNIGDGVLPSSIIFGANASGKSNFLYAVMALKKIVINSNLDGRIISDVNADRFALDESFQGHPTCFDVDFMVSDVRYSYGVSIGDGKVDCEWLHHYPKGSKSVLFERTESGYKFGRHLKGKNSTIASVTRKDSSFLSAAKQFGHEDLSDVISFFEAITYKSMVGIGIESLEATDGLVDGDNIDHRIIKFLGDINTGITEFRIKKTEIFDQFEKMQEEVLSIVEKYTGKMRGHQVKIKNQEIEFGHMSSREGAVFLPFSKESAGTRRLFYILQRVFSTLDAGGVLVIDEIDASLHTSACLLLLELFSDRAVNEKNAQIIVTTHDTNLLNANYIRRDQIWFVEKQNDGSTELIPLTDYRTRKEDNIESGYLRGRYGAMPIIGGVEGYAKDSEGE